jgi:fructose/tagatose bisphosphate aldolase
VAVSKGSGAILSPGGTTLHYGPHFEHLDRRDQGRCGLLPHLHGGSGTGDKDFLDAIHAGINIIHVNTELRVAHGTEVRLTTILA